MKKVLLLLLFLLLPVLAFGQVTLDNFDSSAVNDIYIQSVEGPSSGFTLSDDHVDFVEGIGALDAKVVIGEFHQWGTYAQLIYRVDEDTEPLMDWSVSDSISIWLKVVTPPTHPEWMVFRIHIADRATPDADLEEYIYENTTILDTATDWVELKVPLIEREQPGTDVPNDEGFILVPTSWGGGTYNNLKLDRDKIVGYNICEAM